ncbi:hypothetical protein GYH30_044761 [Glycine max]|nr:hypothetical protein GYH30_044761 [Glycine max]
MAQHPLFLRVLNIRLENGNKLSSKGLKSVDKGGTKALQSPQESVINLSTGREGFEVLNLVGAVKLALKNDVGEVVVLELLLLLEVPKGLDGKRNIPGHALHHLVDKHVPCHDQLHCFWERLSELLELLHSEAIVVDAS